MQGSVEVAHWAHNPKVVGSIPTLASNTMQDGLEVVPARSHKPYHVGSTPTLASKLLMGKRRSRRVGDDCKSFALAEGVRIPLFPPQCSNSSMKFET
jgi:hypothetical protein